MDYDINLRDLDSLHNELMDMQRTVIICTICIVASFLIFLPPIVYLYVRKLERGVWKLNEKTDNFRSKMVRFQIPRMSR